jgi:single-strand DNA-binding protein
VSYNYNLTILVGRLTKDPEVKRFDNDRIKVSFTLAIQRPYRGLDQKNLAVDFIPAIAWGRAAEWAQKMLKKGDAILIEGRIQVRSFLREGNKRWMTEVLVHNFQVMDPSGRGAAASFSEERELDVEEVTTSE